MKTTDTCRDCAHAKRAAIARIVERNVQLLPSGRYVLAAWSDRNAQWPADMSSSAARLTGCSQVSARTLAGIAGDPCVTKYASRSSAVRALRAEEVLAGQGTLADLCPAHRREVFDALDRERHEEEDRDRAEHPLG